MGNTIYADALYSGQTPGTTGTTEWHAFDKDIVGYTYRDSLLGPAAYWATAHPDWVTNDSGVIASVAGNGYGLVLNLYYEANTYRLTLNLDPDTAKGSSTVPAGWTLSADGRSIYRDYLTGQTVDPLPSDPHGHQQPAQQHRGEPYRQGYELIGWSTQSTGALYGAGHVGQQAHDIAQKYFDDAVPPPQHGWWLTARQAVMRSRRHSQQTASTPPSSGAPQTVQRSSCRALTCSCGLSGTPTTTLNTP